MDSRCFILVLVREKHLGGEDGSWGMRMRKDSDFISLRLPGRCRQHISPLLPFIFSFFFDPSYIKVVSQGEDGECG